MQDHSTYLSRAIVSPYIPYIKMQQIYCVILQYVINRGIMKNPVILFTTFITTTKHKPFMTIYIIKPFAINDLMRIEKNAEYSQACMLIDMAINL
jgi:hypothetical protein